VTDEEIRIKRAWARARALVSVQSRTAQALYELFLSSKSDWESEVDQMYAARLQELGVDDHLRRGNEHLFKLDSFESVRDTAAGAFFLTANNICQTLAKDVNVKPGYTLKAGDSLKSAVTFTELAHAAAANFRHYLGWPSDQAKNEIGILVRFGVPPDMMNQNVCGLVVELVKPLNAQSLDLMLLRAVDGIAKVSLDAIGSSPFV
jgi:hypothetical protein